MKGMIALFILALTFLIGVSVFVIAQNKELTAHLDKGWNLVAGFNSIETISNGDITQSNIKAVYGFYSPAQVYVRIYPQPEIDKKNSLEATYAVDGDIISYSAVWVYSDKIGTLNYMPDFEVSLERLSLYKGWNFVPITSEMIGKTLSEVKGNCELMKAYGYSTDGGGQWIDVLNNNLKLNFDIENTGLVIKVSNKCKLLGSSGTPQIPQLPN